MTPSYDAIVIGSGMGGLATARFLSLVYGKRVLLLERHFKLGGFTHTFKRPGKTPDGPSGGYHWDVGLHYVGAMGSRESMGGLFSVLTDGKLKWQKMPDPFERFVFPEFEFAVDSGVERFEAALIAAFPHEEAAIRRYLADVGRVAGWIMVPAARGILPEWIRRTLALMWHARGKLASLTTGEYLHSRFQDPKLRAVLASQWGDYGLPPQQSSFLIHSVIAQHYFEGGYYPVGSSELIAQHIVAGLKNAGSEAKVNHEVTEILVENGRACGVRARGTEFRAPLVISDAGARQTFLKLLPASVKVPFRHEIEQIKPGYSTVSLYLGLKESAAKLGVRGENFWIYSDLDHDQLHARRNELAQGHATSCYLSFPSLKDPAAKSHTAEIVAPLDYSVFAAWRDQEWQKRGPEYQALKERISDALLSLVERRLPGFRDLVAFAELSTPLSNEHFTGHPGGEIYGIPATPKRLEYTWLSAKTFLPGLYLTGSDVASHGIGGALMGGILAVAAIEGPGAFTKIFSRAGRASASSGN